MSTHILDHISTLNDATIDSEYSAYQYASASMNKVDACDEAAARLYQPH